MSACLDTVPFDIIQSADKTVATVAAHYVELYNSDLFLIQQESFSTRSRANLYLLILYIVVGNSSATRSVELYLDTLLIFYTLCCSNTNKENRKHLSYSHHPEYQTLK
jgi:hypothetical protein